MPVGLQAKLLRALQEQEIEALGSNQVTKVDARVIAGDQPRPAAAGGRRTLPRGPLLPAQRPADPPAALRERLEDLEALAEALLDDIARRSGMPHRDVAPDAFAILRAHPWRGNIRELRNVLEQVSMLSDALVLSARHFAHVLPEAWAGSADGAAEHAASQLAADAGSAEAQTGIQPVGAGASPQACAALARTKWPSSNAMPSARRWPQRAATAWRAARLLKISRAALYDKLALYPELTRR